MSDVGLGQKITTTGRLRSRALKDAVSDAHPLMDILEKTNGIRRVSGGRSIVEEAKTAQNSSVAWVGEGGSVSLADQKVIDAAEFPWYYMLGSVSFTLAERYQNQGESQYIDVIAGKFEVLEDSFLNVFHAGLLSNGTGSGGLQVAGLASHVSTTPSTGTVGTIDRSATAAAWFRNQKFDTASDWSDGAVDAGNVKRFLDKGINGTTRDAKSMVTCGFLGQTHFEYLTQAIQAVQIIQNENDTGHAGFQKLVYRGIPMYFGGGINYSGQSALTATRTYLLCTKKGGFNLVYHKNAEFDMLEEIQSSDQAALSRLMFAMLTVTIGGLAKFNWVGFD